MLLKPQADVEGRRDHRTRRRAAWWWLLSVVPFVALCYLAFYEPAGVPLTSGSRVYLAGVSWGKEHRVTAGNGWQRALLTLWPGATGFGGQTASLASRSDQLTISVRQCGRFPSLLDWYSSEGGMQFDLLDEHGCWFDRCYPTPCPDPPLPTTSARQNVGNLARGAPAGIFQLETSTFPRRTGSFICRLTKTWDGEPTGKCPELARLIVPAPIMASSKLGSLEAFPIRRRLGREEFVVESVRLATTSSGWDPSLPHHKFACTVRTGGRRCREWWPARITVADDTGNVSQTDSSVPDQSEADAAFSGLCRFDPAWKYEVFLLRPAASEVPAERSWKLRIPIPTTGNEARLSRRFRDRGVEVEFAGVADAGTITWSNRMITMLDRPAVLVKVIAAPAIAATALRIGADSRGGAPRWGIPYNDAASHERVLGPPDATGMTSDDEIFELPVEPGIRWVEVELRLNLSRRISFVARPPQD